MTPAERLRAAADTIEATANAATPGDWESLDNGDRLVAWQEDGGFRYVVEEPVEDAGTAAHIALWDPPTALLAAAWFRYAADQADVHIDLRLADEVTAFADAIIADGAK